MPPDGTEVTGVVDDEVVVGSVEMLDTGDEGSGGGDGAATGAGAVGAAGVGAVLTVGWATGVGVGVDVVGADADFTATDGAWWSVA